MATSAVFAFFKPDALGIGGYGYGSTLLSSSDQDEVVVTRVPSGRWASLDAFECNRAIAEVQQRSVTKGEALSGIGTYLRVCGKSVPTLGDYGVVTGYTWVQERLTGELSVCFGDESDIIQFNPSEVQDVAIPSYALRPCHGASLADVMPAEMRQRHTSALDHFKGLGARATRNSATILRKLDAPVVDETKTIPLFDINAGKTRPSRSHAGGYNFRRAKSNDGESSQAGRTPPAGTEFLPGQLSDSDESDGEVEHTPVPAVAATPPPRQRKRSSPEVMDEDLRSLQMLRTTYRGNASMMRSIDQVIALRESPMALGSGSSIISYGGAGSNKAQYQPSSLQRVIHGQLVNGTYASIEPQLLLETLQIKRESFAFLPHPAILRAFYSWNFGLRGLSIMHFAPIAGGSTTTASLNMTDFSKAASLPTPAQPLDLGAVIDAIDGLASVVGTVFLPYVVDLVGTARKFGVSLKARNGFSVVEAINELIHWIDERFERVRGFLALRDPEKAQQVNSEFSFAEPSFVRLMQIVTDSRMSALMTLQYARTQGSSAVPGTSSCISRKSGGKLPAHARPPVPQDVQDALPVMNGQRLCMKYLSNTSCPSRQKGCFTRKRGHFAPATLPAIYEKRAYALTLAARQHLLSHHREQTAASLRAALASVELSLSEGPVSKSLVDGECVHWIDYKKQQVFSTFLRKTRMQLPEFVRLIRGETDDDSRPNKALEIPSNTPASTSYQHRHKWEDIVRHGVRPSWKYTFQVQDKPPRNHTSAQRAMSSLVKQIRKGQDADQYLVLDIDLLPSLENVTSSPFGAVQKGTAALSEDARVIHDLSYPDGGSVNDNTVADDSGMITYNGPHDLATRIMEVENEFPGITKLMSGDVAGAFRHLAIHADHVGRFAGTIPELGLLIIDLCCPFGWTLSPQHYWTAGGAISHLYASAAPKWSHQPQKGARTFDAKTWCDDHNLIEPDIGSRLVEANLALRRSMTTILGPEAVNEEKFTLWKREGKMLGLMWNIPRSTLAMPPEKITKALCRIDDMLRRERTTQQNIRKLLGSLRHVVTCIPAAKPFFQQLSALTWGPRRYSAIRVTAAARDDLYWFRSILYYADLNAVPLSRFSGSQPVDYEIFMDASDYGLCAVFPTRREYIQVRFNQEELLNIAKFRATGDGDYNINLRELMSAVYASITWGSNWAGRSTSEPCHVRFWIDNTSAIAWNNRRSSRNHEAQRLLRILSLLEVKHSFFASAAHIPGENNVLADAGSRVWQSQRHLLTFTNIAAGWSQSYRPAQEISRKFGSVFACKCSGRFLATALQALLETMDRVVQMDGILVLACQ
ncbi:LOW QUALITY PROTEIN: Cleavage induced protein [Phytophthora megakarya]|uniref:Cleavage induced protein n=1 Tax=Phytophthora megakarya TaxID=4795 RepID=A0A225VYQ3_9STRA|nr:LOW QUALITY PROTEIN: Cleavage induced protein [Phytophthora megakarya]